MEDGPISLEKTVLVSPLRMSVTLGPFLFEKLLKSWLDSLGGCVFQSNLWDLNSEGFSDIIITSW